MVAVIRGKLKCYCYNPLGLGRNYFLPINFASVQELVTEKKRKKEIKLNEQLLPQNRLWHRKNEKYIKTAGQQFSPNEAAKKQSSIPWNIQICLILWRAVAHVFSQRPSKWHCGDGNASICLYHAAASTQISLWAPGWVLRNPGWTEMYKENSSEALGACAEVPGLQRKPPGDKIC